MMGEACFPSNEPHTEQSKAMQQFLPLDVAHLQFTWTWRGQRIGRLPKQDAPEPYGKKVLRKSHGLYASGCEPSTAALDSYQCPYGHVCR